MIISYSWPSATSEDVPMTYSWALITSFIGSYCIHGCDSTWLLRCIHSHGCCRVMSISLCCRRGYDNFVFMAFCYIRGCANDVFIGSYYILHGLLLHPRM